jgi:fructokinase
MENNAITIYGEVLFDHFANGSSVLGGAPFNVAWHLQAFNQSPQLISRVGADIQGKQIRKAMQLWGMNLNFLQNDPTLPTGMVQVTLNHGEPDYTILDNQAYDHIHLQDLKKINCTGFLYHGTLAARSETSRLTLQSLKQHFQGRIFFDVNLRKPWWNKNEVIQLIDEANWIKLNIDELQALQFETTEPKSCMEIFVAQHNLEGMILTCGKEGAFALKKNGQFFSVSPSEITEVIDTVGAGDAFCSVILLGLNLGWDLEETMARAQRFATAVTKHQGATVADKNFYLPYIKNWSL